MKTRVAVVGAGIIGLSAAWRLAQQGCDVTVCERGTAGKEASWAAAGMLAPGGEFDEPSELAALAIAARAQYSSFVRDLEEASGLSIDYQECGALSVAYSEVEAHELEQRASRQWEMGIESKAVATARVKAFWPRVRTKGLAGARFYPGDGVVDPRHLLNALRGACWNAGVPIVERCEVLRINVRPEFVDVYTPVAISRYDAAVIAAGAWSGSIATDPPLPASEPVKGHLIAYRQPVQTCSSILRHEHNYILQRANGLLIVGSSAERIGFDRTLDTTIVEALSRKAGFLLPHLAETSATDAWTGFRPSSDGLHIGPWHSERLQLAFGHFRNGILLAPITADRIAAAVTSSLGRPRRALA